MRAVFLPGVFRPRSDTWMLAGVARAPPLPPGARVLDLCSGSGALAIRAALAGAETVAVDISRRAVFAARFNSFVNRLPIRVHHGDLLSRTNGEFDLIVANPPYVPCGTGAPGRHSRARAWDAGLDGRLVLDRLCEDIPRRLRPGGSLLLVHSALCDPARTLDLLGEQQLRAEVIRKAEIPFGPVKRSRTAWLRDQGLIGPDEDMEGLVVIRGWRDG